MTIIKYFTERNILIKVFAMAEFAHIKTKKVNKK